VMMYAPGKASEVELAFKQAIKADVAAVPVHLWDDRVWEKMFHLDVTVKHFKVAYQNRCPLDTLRVMLLRHWQISICWSFL